MTTKKEAPAGVARRPEDWTAAERLRVVLEASKLDDAGLGALLRREGLHEETLREWQESALEALQPAQAPKARGGDKKRIKQLERELARKEKVLAEAAALLILKKKYQALLAGEDEPTDPSSDE